jgi:lia operon protein LiaG
VFNPSRSLVPCALALAVVSGSANAQADRHVLSGRTAAFYNLVGNVRVVAGTGSETVIEVTRRGRDADQLRVVSGVIDGVQTLRVIYPADDILATGIEGNTNTTIDVNEDGTFGRGRGRYGNQVRIHTSDRGGRDSFEASADLVVRVPVGVALQGHMVVGLADVRGTRSDLELSNVAGDVVITGASGAFRVSTASGNVDVSQTSADVEVNTASGDVVLTALRANRVKVDVASGDVRLRDVATGDLNISTASGDVDATMDGEVTHADLSTASGTVTVALGPRVNATIDVGTASGDIDVDFPLQVRSDHRNHVRGRIGSGAGDIRIGAASGDVRVTRLNARGSR